VSTFGTWLAFDAFPLVAILVLDASPAQVSALAATGLAVGAVLAVPLGPWVERRRRRPVMVAMDLVRFAALLSVPVAYAVGRLTFMQLVVVAVVAAAADITFKAASGAYLKSLVAPDQLLVANGRFESTAWTATALAPPLGGAAIGVLGPMTTVVANAASFVLSALGIRAISGSEAPAARGGAALRAGDVLEGWRTILRHPALRPLFVNTVLVNALILATAPLLAVLMLGRLGFAPWQYALAFGVPCLGGLVGSRLARPLARRFGPDRVLRVAGTLRVCPSICLALVGPGARGLVLVLVSQCCLVTAIGVFNPLLATRRLQLTPDDRVARVLSAWSVTSSAAVAAATALWGVVAGVAGLRPAIAAAGVLLLATPLLLWRCDGSQAQAVANVPSPISGGLHL
jgi:MFS family permease